MALPPSLEELQELESCPTEVVIEPLLLWLTLDLDLAAGRGTSWLGTETAPAGPSAGRFWERLAGMVCIQPMASVSLGIHTTISSSGS